MNRLSPIPLLLLLACLQTGCAIFGNPYTRADANDLQLFKRTILPIRTSQTFEVVQGPFGNASHSEAGNQYSWDFAVPFGTDVLAVEGGRVLDVFQPKKAAKGGCDPKFAADAHNIKIEHYDGTVAQYVHINSSVQKNSTVVGGQVIGRTANNGWLCRPHLHFSVYRSATKLYDSPNRETIPLFFEQVPGGILREGFRLTDQFKR